MHTLCRRLLMCWWYLLVLLSSGPFSGATTPPTSIKSSGHWNTTSKSSVRKTATCDGHNARMPGIVAFITCCPASHNQSTPFYTFDDPNIQQYNNDPESGLHRILSSFSNKTTAFFGDSIMRQKYFAMIMFLQTYDIPFTHNVTEYEFSHRENHSYQVVQSCHRGKTGDMCRAFEFLPQSGPESATIFDLVRRVEHHHKVHPKESPSKHAQNSTSTRATTTPSSDSTNQTRANTAYPCSCSNVFTLHIPSYNAVIYAVNFFRFMIPLQYEPRQEQEYTHENTVIHYQILEDMLPRVDHVLFNLGLHEERSSLSYFGQRVRYVIDVLRNDMEKRPMIHHADRPGEEHKPVPPRWRRRHAFYLTEPVHFKSSLGYGDYFSKDSPSSDHTSICMKTTKRPMTAAVAAGILDGELTYIDTLDLLWDQGDKHLDVFVSQHGDCTHWCFSYEQFQARFSMIAAFMNSDL